MINFIKKLLGIHTHQWSKWEVTHRFTAQKTATVCIVQERRCITCGKTNIEEQLL